MNIFLVGIARTLWVHHWAREQRKHAEENEEHVLPWREDTELDRVAPETPPAAWADAGRLIGMIEERHGKSLEECWRGALYLNGKDWQVLTPYDANESRKEFACSLAAEALGEPATWGDGYDVDHGVVVPQLELEYMPKVFSGVLCSTCREDVGSDWDNCDRCRLVVCSRCRPTPEFICFICLGES